MIKLIKWIIFYLNIIYKLHFNPLHLSNKTIWFVLLICKGFGKTISLDCLTEWYEVYKTTSVVLLGSWNTCQDILCQDNRLSYRDLDSARQSGLSARLKASKTILDCLAERFLQTIPIVLPNENCLTEVLNCLTGFKIVFLHCFWLSRQL